MIKLRSIYNHFTNGNKSFLLGIAGWILHMFDETVNPDFWVTIDSTWLLHQEFKVYTMAVNINTGEILYTHPDKKCSKYSEKNPIS